MEKYGITKYRLNKKRVALCLLCFAAAMLLLWEVFGAGLLLWRAQIEFVPTLEVKTEQINSTHITSHGVFLINDSVISFYNSRGERVFTHKHGLINPRTFTSQNGDFVAVASVGGNIVNLYSVAGFIFTSITPYPISNLAVNNYGVIAVILRNNDSSHVALYNLSGYSEQLINFDTSRSVPMAIRFSPCGKNLAIALTEVNMAGVLSRVKLVSAAYGNILAKSNDIERQIIGQLHYMEGNILVAVSDAQIFGIDAPSGYVVWAMPLANRVSASYFDENLFAIIHNNVEVYNADGIKVFSVEKDKPSHVFISNGHIIVVDSEGIFGYNVNGDILWRLSPNADSIVSIGFLNNLQQLVIIQQGGIRFFERR